MQVLEELELRHAHGMHEARQLPDSGDGKDSLGVSLSERFGILALNGILLLLGALVVALLKFISPS